MRVHVSICSLLACATFGLLAEADPIRTGYPESAEENLIHDNDYMLANRRSAEILRFQREIEHFPKGLKIENDHGELMELTMGVTRGEMEEEEFSAERSESFYEERVFFHLYTRKNPSAYQPLWINDRDALKRSFFNTSKPTYFVTHGWVNSGSSEACVRVRDAYLKNDDFNVIVIDWSRITVRPYGWAAAHVLGVGKHVSQMINFLERHAGLDTGRTSLVGHSLGAHVMGLAGYYARGTVNYVIGLDPALPLFIFAGPGERISVEDAKHVQIIHTNAGLLGFLEAIGHTDFYPNGGSWQLGCLVDVGGACSHARSYKFFAESINTPVGFVSKPCESFLNYILGLCKTGTSTLMGGRLIDFPNHGKYFLSTRSASPYAKGR